MNTSHVITFICAATFAVAAFASEPVELTVKSSIDGSMQPAQFIPARSSDPRPLLVSLHTWSAHYNKSSSLPEWIAAAEKRDWHLLFPEFRGPNKNPAACASQLARQDVIDALDYAMKKWKVDGRRVYVAGGSGGGHMTLVMASFAPDRWAAASAWVPITDLRAWHRETIAAGHGYWKDVEAVCGGAPGTSLEVDEAYHYRSPLSFLYQTRGLPLEVSAGIHDGYAGSVPIHHTLDAYDALAKTYGVEPISRATRDQLEADRPNVAGAVFNPVYGRAIHWRGHAGPSRVTIFEGGHEMLPEAACVFLERHHK